MVRYPQKNPSEIPSQPSESVSPKIVNEIKAEKKLEPQVPRHNRAFFYAWLIFFGVIFIGLTLINNLYVSTFTIELNQKGFNWSGEWDNSFSESSAGFEKYPPFIWDMKYLNLKEINVAENGKLISVRIYAFGRENSRQMAEDWEKDFARKYSGYRKNILMGLIDARHKEISRLEIEIEEVLGQMSKFKPDERYFIVNESSKEKLIKLTKQNTPELERNFQYIKDQLTGQDDNKSLNRWSLENKMLLETYRLRLTDIEFKEFLIGPDFLNNYEEGVRVVKTAIARLIDEQARQDNEDEAAASLMIKDFLLNCRREAIEAVLNKRFVVSIDELSGARAGYIQLNNKFDALNLKLNSILSINKEVEGVLEEGFSQEVSVKSTLKIVKF